MSAMPEDVPYLKRIHDAILPEVWIEIVFLILGWGLIYSSEQSMAPLRCFRLLRFVWYAEFFRAKKGTIFYPVTFICHVVLQYLEKIGEELFTTASKGGVIVLGFFFYMAYIMGVSFYYETMNMALASPEGGPSGTLSQCDTLPHCFLVML